jgi:hypothetical protein
MGKQVLLVEPSYSTYKNPYPPLGLMRISTYHKRRGDHVDFLKENAPNNYFGYRSPQLKDQYDVIYISSLFTYHFQDVIKTIKYFQNKYPYTEVKVGGVAVTLLPDLIKKETGITPHIGLLNEVEECPPDYSLFPSLPFSITTTTRGCIRKCKFCVVHLIEPNYFVREEWENDINPNSKKIIFWDNNWLSSPNFNKDIEKLKKIGKPFDFNQGIDCRLFDEEKAELISQTKIDPLRFAFDSPSQEDYIQNAINLARKYGFTNNIMVYVLYNSEEAYDTPEYFYYRINELNKFKIDVYPMRYRPINNIQRHIISPNWSKTILRGIKLVTTFYYSKGIIRRDRKAFLKIFGENEREFKYKMRKIYFYDKKIKKQGVGIKHQRSRNLARVHKCQSSIHTNF